MAAKKGYTRTKAGNEKHKKTGCLLWLFLLLLTLLLFVIKWGSIKETLSATGFMDAVKTLEEEKPPVKGDGSLEPSETPITIEAPVKTTQQEKPSDEKAVTKEPEKTAEPVKPGSPATEYPQSQPVEIIKSTRVASLYFVQVDDDGIISRHEVKRTISASDSPLTDALAALLAGPSTQELSKGYISLIPAGTRLLSAQVRGSTAYLDFNEAFMYNRYGIEGYAGQLRQIIYTACSFSTVKDIQILIEGQKREYLGGDGVYIGKPLSKSSF